MRSSSSNSSLHSVESTPPDIINEQTEPARPGTSRQPTEGVLVKTKLHSLAASRPDLHIYSASRGGEVNPESRGGEVNPASIGSEVNPESRGGEVIIIDDSGK